MQVLNQLSVHDMAFECDLSKWESAAFHSVCYSDLSIVMTDDRSFTPEN